MPNSNQFFMKEQKESFFKHLEFLLLNRNIRGFRDYIIEFYSKSKCECFFTKQNDLIKQNLLKIIEKYPDSSDSENLLGFFPDLSLEKGVLYLWNHQEYDAYKNLTKAIAQNYQNDLLYSLRSSINSEINPDYLEDAKWAVIINPSPINYSAFVNALSKSEKFTDDFKAKFIEKVIESKPDCGCAYFNRGKLFENHDRKSDALEYYRKGLSLGPDNNEIIFKLPALLTANGYYEESNNYVKSILKIKPNEHKLYYLLAKNFYHLGEQKNQRRYLERYLKIVIHNDQNFDDIEGAKLMLYLLYKKLLEESYAQKLYDDVIQFSELIYNLSGRVHYLYYYSILLSQDNNISIGKDNKHYIELDTLIRNNKFERKIFNFIKEYQPSDILNFGKYSGQNIDMILTVDSHYLINLIIKNNHFAVSLEIFLNEQFKALPDYYKALEINIIKIKLIDVHNLDGFHDSAYREEQSFERDFIKEMRGDWGGLYGEEAEAGYWNTD